MSVSRILLWAMRIGAGVLVVVGLALWTGTWYALVGMHRTAGVVYVLVFWSLAILALTQRRNVKLALFAVVWGLVIAMLGFAQQRLLVGDLHWIVRIVHLLVGVSAIPIAERLARRSTSTAASASASVAAPAGAR